MNLHERFVCALCGEPWTWRHQCADFTTPGNPARSKWSGDGKVSIGSTDHGQAVAAGMAEPRA